MRIGPGRLDLAGVVLICMAVSGCHTDTAAEAREKAEERARSAASSAARSFLRRFSKPEPSTEAAWGLRDFRSFGPFSWQPDIRETPAGLYTGSFSLWCSGFNSGGHSVKRKRTLAVDVLVVGADASIASIQDAHFVADQELSAWEQYGGWIGATLGLAVLGHFWARAVVWALRLWDRWGSGMTYHPLGLLACALLVPLYFYPVLIPLAAASCCRLFAHKAARVGAAFGYLLHVGLAGWLFFGSWLAVCVPGASVLLLCALAWATVAAAEARERERRKAEAAAAKTTIWDDTETIFKQLGKKPKDI